MSRRPGRLSSKEQIGNKPSVARSQASARSSTASGRSSLSRGIAGKPSATSSKSQIVEKPSEPEIPEDKPYNLPALSVAYKPKVTESEFQKMKKRTIRRHNPPGENIKQIKEILKSLKKTKTTVHEFISLVAPSTADKSATLKSVMQEDLNAFRKLARRVYDTITQDSSDVLLNQQLQLAEYYKERKQLLHDKMMKYIEEIYMLAPKFDFDRYAKDKEKYLLELFPLPEDLNIEPEEFEAMKRQAAYHRLQWLRSEGERLNDENNSLKKRLNQLKRQHKEEQMKMLQMEEQAEAKKAALEAQEAEKTETLEMLNESLEKTIIDKEKMIRQTKDKCLVEPYSSKKQESSKQKKARGKQSAWNELAAKEIEAQALETSELVDALNITKKGSSAKTRPRSPSPFHYSPPKTPPQVTPPRPVSPQPAQQAPVIRGRRTTRGPSDQWGGFY